MTGKIAYLFEDTIIQYDFDLFRIRSSENIPYDQFCRREQDPMKRFLDRCLMAKYMYQKDPIKYGLQYSILCKRLAFR